MENFLNKRLKVLEKVHKDALANNNYSLALTIYIKIDEIKDLLYLLKNEENLKSNTDKDDKEVIE